MSKFIKYALFSAIPLVVIITVWFVNQNETREPVQDQKNPGVVNTVTQGKQLDTTEILLSDLNITPLQSLEKEIYMLTAFDVINESTLVFAGNYANENVVRFFDLETNKVIEQIILDEIVLDIYSRNDTCYILAEKSIFVLYQNQIISDFRHNIPRVFTFDRLLLLDDMIFVSMSDGSAYLVGENDVEKLDRLVLNGQSLWIQKRSSFVFDVELADDKVVNYTSGKELGAMTVLGEINDNLVCIVEKFTKQKPLEVSRIIASSATGFSEVYMTVDMQPYAFFKNDLRLHGSLVHHLILYPDKVVLITESIEK